ncbi:MAG: hypothetical protein RLZZ158_1716 [Cyanobacteriota bacterium]|jgi:hypothetical protein
MVINKRWVEPTLATVTQRIRGVDPDPQGLEQVPRRREPENPTLLNQ